jgi:hypothetical protein
MVVCGHIALVQTPGWSLLGPAVLHAMPTLLALQAGGGRTSARDAPLHAVTRETASTDKMKRGTVMSGALPDATPRSKRRSCVNDGAEKRVSRRAQSAMVMNTLFGSST